MVFLVVKGVLRGFIREVASLFGIILGIWLANEYHPRMTTFLKPYLPGTPYLALISFCAIFILIVLLCNLFGWGLKQFFSKVFLGWLDRALGAALAVLKGVILAYLVIVLLTFFLPASTPLMAGSVLRPQIIKSYQAAVGLISPDHYERWKERLAGKDKETENRVGQSAGEFKKKNE